MSIEEHVPDGTFVNAVAGLVNPQFKLHELRDGRQILTGGADFTPQEYGEALLAEPRTLHVSTLTGIVEYYKAGIHADYKVVVNVTKPDRVYVTAPRVNPNITEQTFTFAVADPDVPHLDFGSYMPIDLFILHVQTNFIDTPERTRLLLAAGRLSNGIKSEIDDDGVTQSVTTRKGITRIGSEKFENPVKLQPYRTFTEIDQPESEFVFRMKSMPGDDDAMGVAGALFEADGGIWRTKAIQDIGAWLKDKLPDAVILA